MQEVFEEIIINKLKKLRKKYNFESLCISGGCGFNSSLNGKIIKESKFKKIFFSPNVGDAGGSVGAALYEAIKNKENLIVNSSPYLGPGYSNKDIERSIYPFTK